MRVDIVKVTEIFMEEDRARVEYGDLGRLCESIKTFDVIQTIAVKEGAREKGFKYTLLAGGRRFKASLLAEKETVPVRIFPKDLSNEECLKIELEENTARQDLSWSEKDLLTKKINDLQIAIHGRKQSSADKTGWSDTKTAELLNRAKSGVSESINMAKAIEAFPELRNVKTRKEARKILRSIGSTVRSQENAKKIQKMPIDTVRARLIENFHIEDFFKGIEKVPKGSIDMVEIDPPYGIDLKEIRKKSEKKADIGLSNYNEIPESKYEKFLSDVFSALSEKMNPDSWLVCWFDIKKLDMINRLLKIAGFDGRAIPGIWSKELGQSQRPYRYLSSNYETFFYARKGDAKLARPGRSNVFTYSTVHPKYKVHPTERPVELITDLLSTFVEIPQGHSPQVLVPFLGSGNTLLAAANLGLNSFGFELSSGYKDKFIEKVSAGHPPNYTSYVSEK